MSNVYYEPRRKPAVYVNGYEFYSEDDIRKIVKEVLGKGHITWLAKRTGLSYPTIRNWLAGKHSIRYDNLFKIVTILHITG